MSMFRPSNTNEIRKTLQDTIKTCELDPLPGRQLKDCIESLVPVIMKITNSSLAEGFIPEELKEAIVRPLIKKPTLDKDVLKNYRPVSNITHLSKVMEKIVAKQLTDHCMDQGLFDSFQSAYRKHHSTETALVCVVNDIRAALDRKQGTMVVLIDLSAAFDTIDHEILLTRLNLRYGFSGTVLKWLISYLENRKQSVVIGSASSDPMTLKCGSLRALY
jgi:hypothetical protein